MQEVSEQNTIVQLKEIAKQLNIKGIASMKKSSLIEKINAVITEQNAEQENKKGEKVVENIKASDSEIKNDVLRQSTTKNSTDLTVHQEKDE